MLDEELAVDLGGVLPASIGVVHAARRRSTSTERSLEGRQRQARVDRAADRIPDHPARPGIEDGSQIDEACRDRDVGDVGDPELVRSVDHHASGPVRENRAIVIAVGGGDEPPATPRLQVVRAHEPAHPLAVDDDPLVAQRGADATIAVAFELVADRAHARDDFSLVGRCGRHVVERGARQAHQPASLGDGETPGPVITDVAALLVRAALADAPLSPHFSQRVGRGGGLAVGADADGAPEGVASWERWLGPLVGRAAAARGAGRGGMPGRSEGGALQVEIGEVVLGLVGTG